MSAIAGMVSKKRVHNTAKIIKMMNESQAHRGPDGEGIFESGNACLGHRLLNLTKNRDVSKEPIFDEKKSIAITCDASIYNSKELRRNLKQEGRESHSDSNTELILQLYEAQGPRCVDNLRGDFAFAIWDGKAKKVFMARDRFGMKPLFYSYKKGAWLLFASELNALIVSGMVEKNIDFEAIYHYLFYTFFHQPLTPLREIKSLLPGHYITYYPESDKFEIVKYWEVPFSKFKTKNEKFLISEFEKLLHKSIVSRIEQDVSVGVSLSGGIDSSFIAAIIAKTGCPLKTMTFGFRGEGEEYNEFRYAKEVALRIGSDHHEFILTGKAIRRDLPNMIRHLETPTSGIILPYFLAKAASQKGVDLTFRGDGAHSLFESPEEEKFKLVDRVFSILKILPASLQKHIIKYMESAMNQLVPYYKIRETNIKWIFHLLSRYLKVISGKRNMDVLFSESRRKTLFLEAFWENENFKETSEIVLGIMDQIMTRDVREKMIYEEYKRFPDQALMYISNVHSGFSIECRQPYWESTLVEFSQNYLPLNLRRKGKEDKYILKTLGRKVLPKEIIDRPQHGFYMPIHKWLRGDLKPVVDDVFSETSVKKRGIFRWEAIRSIYDEYYTNQKQANSWRRIWSLVALETWFRIFCDRDV